MINMKDAEKRRVKVNKKLLNKEVGFKKDINGVLLGKMMKLVISSFQKGGNNNPISMQD